MRTKQHLVSFAVANILSSSAYAAPPLQMHVYEEPTTKTSSTIVGEAVQPERLRVHVYENKPKVSSEQGHRAHAAVHQDEPLVSYNAVDFYIGAELRRDKLFDEKFHSNQLGAGLTIYLSNNWLITSRVAYGEVGSGRVIVDGDLFDASFSFGKVIPRQSPFSGFDRIEWRPEFGYSYHEQSLEAKSADSAIKSRWHGPWLGGSATLIQEDNFAIGLNLAYHYAFVDIDTEYRKWEPSDTRANGFSTRLFTHWDVSTNFALKLDVISRYWKTNASAEEELKWKSLGAEVGVEYQF